MCRCVNSEQCFQPFADATLRSPIDPCSSFMFFFISFVTCCCFHLNHVFPPPTHTHTHNTMLPLMQLFERMLSRWSTHVNIDVIMQAVDSMVRCTCHWDCLPRHTLQLVFMCLLLIPISLCLPPPLALSLYHTHSAFIHLLMICAFAPQNREQPSPLLQRILAFL